jgi:hypothetical protein
MAQVQQGLQNIFEKPVYRSTFLIRKILKDGGRAIIYVK